MFLGYLTVKTDKTSEPERKQVHHLGMIAGGTGKKFLDSSKTILTWESFDPMRAGASNSPLAVVVGLCCLILNLTLFLYNQHSGSLEAIGASLMRLGWLCSMVPK